MRLTHRFSLSRLPIRMQGPIEINQSSQPAPIKRGLVARQFSSIVCHVESLILQLFYLGPTIEQDLKKRICSFRWLLMRASIIENRKLAKLGCGSGRRETEYKLTAGSSTKTKKFYERDKGKATGRRDP